MYLSPDLLHQQAGNSQGLVTNHLRSQAKSGTARQQTIVQILGQQLRRDAVSGAIRLDVAVAAREILLIDCLAHIADHLAPRSEAPQSGESRETEPAH